jgi:LacI family transcriptional regulator
MKRRSTVIHVASAAGVSPSTVSRFLRGNPVRPGFAERISKAVQDLQYEPDETARVLRGGRTRIIGVLFPKVSSAYFSRALQCIEEEAAKGGYTVVLLTHRDDLDVQRGALIAFRRSRVDGVILTAAPGASLEDVTAALPKVPIVAFESFFSPKLDSILLENRESARVATDHLLGHGYKSVGCIGARPNVFSYQERVAGYSEAVLSCGMTPQVIMATTFDHLSVIAHEKLRKREFPEAVLALSDIAAGNILAACQNLGMPRKRIPRMIAYDDFEFASLLQIPLTVVRQPVKQMVDSAMRSLRDRMDGTNTGGPETVSMPGELIIRRSCGC